MKPMNRRTFLRVAGLSLLTPYVLTYAPKTVVAQTSSDVLLDERWFAVNPAQQPEGVFSLSVASGDPSPSGVVLWTRVNPEVWSADRPLAFEVAEDDQFQQIVAGGLINGADFGPERDHTVLIDLDGTLSANQVYYYRFIYNETASRVGRCRTLPAVDEDIERVRFAVLTCQDYTNGYYGAFAHLAQEEIDFVIHLGDFIYESAADPRFQPLPFPDRAVVLPSGEQVAFDLNDYRSLYRTYRSDPFFQAALEQHTWIIIWDDHETANDCYWDKERDTLGAPDHPFTTDPQFGNDPVRLNQLKFDAQRAWAEYVPARVRINENATHPQDYLQIYRQFAFGSLVDLFMTDERTYRSAHPCGDGDLGERYASPGCEAQFDPERTMLGKEQRDWLIAGMKDSQALWKAWGNEVFQATFKLGPIDDTTIYFNLDAWDGYEQERVFITRELSEAGVHNLVVLTGDLHSYIVSYLKIDYDERENFEQSNLVGVEFMTPSVTSANFKEIIENAVTYTSAEEQALQEVGTDSLIEDLVRLTNPHIKFFNSLYWGYATVEFNRSYCEYTAYDIDKSQNSADVAKRELRRLRVPVNRVVIEDA